MIGDIDILVSPEDYKKTISLFKSEGFNELLDYNFFDPKHYPRMVNKDKLFAIEIHSRITRYKLQFQLKIFVTIKLKNRFGVNTPNYSEILLNNIYGHQINDYGYLNLNYNFRNLYDSYKLMKIENVKIKSLRDHKIMSYFYVMEFLKILSEPNENNFYKSLYS